jgi:hypothetical protein
MYISSWRTWKSLRSLSSEWEKSISLAPSGRRNDNDPANQIKNTVFLHLSLFSIGMPSLQGGKVAKDDHGFGVFRFHMSKRGRMKSVSMDSTTLFRSG